MSNPLKMVETDAIAPRQVGEAVPEISTVDPGLGAYRFGDLAEYVDFAKVMCQGGPMIPEFMRNQPGICLAITLRAVHWGFDPYALSMEAYQAKSGGPVGFQGKVFTAALRSVAGIQLQYEFTGEITRTGKPALSANGKTVAKNGATGDRKCRAFVEVDGVELDYVTPTLDQITIKNSALWHNDPDQQLAYYAARGWARRHRPDVMMGAYSEDEVADMTMKDVTPKPSAFAQRVTEARGIPDQAQSGQPETASDGTPGQDTEDAAQTEDTGADAAHADTEAYRAGRAAAEEGVFSRADCPHTEDPNAAAAWFAGFDSVAEGG